MADKTHTTPRLSNDHPLDDTALSSNAVTTIEGGWVLERGSAATPHYAGVVDGMLSWTPDNLKALRFARRKDADDLSEIMDDADRVAYHEWG